MAELTLFSMVEAVRRWRAGQRGRVALVPTMGNLHAGHRALIEAAVTQADAVVVSGFVNPTQFAPGEDYASYPRTPEQDLALMRDAGADAVFTPSVDEMYPFGADAATVIEVPALSGMLDGASRPGHFRGVASVVARLFGIVAPDVALFGEKDYQQLLVIRRMVRELFMPVAIVGVPSVREADGLALSSRNAYLAPDERARAPALHAALLAAAEAFRDGGEAAQIERDGLAALKAAGFKPEYFAVREAASLEAPRPGEPCVILAAGWLGKARLIDNVRLD